MLSTKEFTEIAVKISEEFRETLEKAHLSSDTKQIALIMEEVSTAIIKELTDKKAMGELSMNFNSLIKYFLEYFPRFYYYFDMLSQNRNKTPKRIYN